MSYIGVPPFGRTVRTTTELTATAGQTNFMPAGGYIQGYVDVFLNGVSLAASDFTATDGTNIVLTAAAALNDEIKVIAYWPVSMVDTYRKGETDTLLDTKLNIVNPSYTGTLTGDTGVINLGSGQVYKSASGNVGIGTDQPNEKVTIVSSTSASYIQICDSSTGNTSNDGVFLGSFNGVAELKTKESNVFILGTNNTERFRIDADGRVGVNTIPHTSVPSSLQYARVGKRYLATGNMNGSTWVNTGVTFNPTGSFAYVAVDALGHENGRNNGFRRYILTYNFFNGWSTSGPIYTAQHGSGNDYGQVVVAYQNGRLEVRAANNVSGGNYYVYATEYVTA